MLMSKSMNEALTCWEESHSNLPIWGSMAFSRECAMGLPTSRVRPPMAAALTAGDDASYTTLPAWKYCRLFDFELAFYVRHRIDLGF